MKKAKTRLNRTQKLTESHVPLKISSVHISKIKKT